MVISSALQAPRLPSSSVLLFKLGPALKAFRGALKISTCNRFPSASLNSLNLAYDRAEWIVSRIYSLVVRTIARHGKICPAISETKRKDGEAKRRAKSGSEARCAFVSRKALLLRRLVKQTCKDRRDTYRGDDGSPKRQVFHLRFLPQIFSFERRNHRRICYSPQGQYLYIFKPGRNLKHVGRSSPNSFELWVLSGRPSLSRLCSVKSYKRRSRGRIPSCTRHSNTARCSRVPWCILISRDSPSRSALFINFGS